MNTLEKIKQQQTNNYCNKVVAFFSQTQLSYEKLEQYLMIDSQIRTIFKDFNKLNDLSNAILNNSTLMQQL